MESHEIFMEGEFKHEEVAELPTADASNTGREVYYNGSRYYCDGVNWVIYTDTTYIPPNGGYGYAIGGAYASTLYSIIERITFPFDSGTATNVGNLNYTVEETCGCNSTNYGYLCGGAFSTYSSVVSRIAFPFDSGTASDVGLLTKTRREGCSCNCSSYGYVIGGRGGSAYTDIDRITFPFDSGTATYIGDLAAATYIIGGGVNSSSHGYSFNGYASGYSSAINRITFPFDSGTMSQVGNTTESKGKSFGCNSSIEGYIMGGSPTTNVYVTTLEYITFPFDSGTSAGTGNLSQTICCSSACNSTNYGYRTGGNNTTWHSVIDRFLFPFHSGSASYIGALATSRSTHAGVDETDFNELFI